MGFGERQRWCYYTHDKTRFARHAKAETGSHRKRLVQCRIAAHATVGCLRGNQGKQSGFFLQFYFIS